MPNFVNGRYTICGCNIGGSEMSDELARSAATIKPLRPEPICALASHIIIESFQKKERAEGIT